MKNSNLKIKLQIWHLFKWVDIYIKYSQVLFPLYLRVAKKIAEISYSLMNGWIIHQL